jgi:hypothetical protein
LWQFSPRSSIEAEPGTSRRNIGIDRCRIIAMTRLEEDLRSAFERATDGSGSQDDVRAAARQLVRQLDSGGTPPEKIIVAVKQACGLPLITIAGDTDASADIAPTKQVFDLVVRTVIDEYYSRPKLKTKPA